MTARDVPGRLLFLTFALVASLASIGCGGGEPAFEVEQATVLIKAEFPDSELDVRTARVDEEGRGVVFARFNEQMVNFFFLPAEDGWTLDAVDFDGSFYYIRDLEQISTTMALMVEVADALQDYKEANEAYPVGDTHEALHTLSPQFMSDETDYNDAWDQEITYESDGDDYTMVSFGADKQEGTADDIILVSGEFVGANREGEGGQQ